MRSAFTPAAHKGRLSLSISQDVLDRLEPYKQEVNVSAHVEDMLKQLLEQLENRQWLLQCAEPLARYGEKLQASGVAGEEFDRT